MAGTVVIIVVLVLIVPVAVMASAPLFTAALGALLKRDVDAAHEGSELLELSEKY